MNGKEVNNLIVDGIRFRRSYDDYIGKKATVHERAGLWQSIGAQLGMSDSDSWSSDWSGGSYRCYYAAEQNATIIGWNISFGDQVRESDFFRGLWFLLDNVKDNSGGPQGSMWVNANSVSI